ncbi:hypothetical protein [Flavobacterium rhizosphaerae]|uniref:Uncharacterized protein n=1 Tax=Flavobacterium rhizosphaerae TaxID=3163298 RepID=A0ABW8YRS6_9FLAO
MSDDKKHISDSSNNGNIGGRVNGGVEKSSLPDYKYTPPPPRTDIKPTDKK